MAIRLSLRVASNGPGRCSPSALVRSIAAFALAVVLASCGGGGGGDTAAASGSSAQEDASVLHASPQASCQYEHVYVTVGSLRLRQQGNAGEPWREVVLAMPRRIDLLQAGQGLLQALGVAPLPAGHYTEIRLVLAEPPDDPLANAVQPAGASLLPLKVPSGSSSGLKLVGDFDVPGPRSADVVLDGFDPCVAIARAGKHHRLGPQLHARAVPLPVELELKGDAVIPVPGGGFAVLRRATDAVDVQRFSALGAVVGSAVRIGLDGVTVGTGGPVAVTALATGGYALSWVGPALAGTPFPPYPVMVRFHDAGGAPTGAAQQVGVTQPFRSPVVQWPPPVAAALAGGGFVVAWIDPDHHLVSQPFDAAGQRLGGARLSGMGETNIHVTGLASGNYMLASGLVAIQARPYAADGTELGPARTVVADTGWTPFSATDIALAALADGGAVVGWFTSTIDQPSRFFVQRVAADASPLGAPVQVSADGGRPQAAGLGNGSFVVAWPWMVRAFGPDAAPLGEPVQVRPPGTPAVALQLLPVGNDAFLVAWSAAPAGSGSLVVRFFFPPNPPSGTA